MCALWCSREEITLCPDHAVNGLGRCGSDGAHGKRFWRRFRYAVEAFCAVLVAEVGDAGLLGKRDEP